MSGKARALWQGYAMSHFAKMRQVLNAAKLDAQDDA